MKKAMLICASLTALLLLGGCSQAKQAYIATDGNLTIGAGQYKQGEWVNAACDFTTGKVNITSTHITSAIPLKLDGQYLICDAQHKKLIATVNVPEKRNSK